MSVNTYSTSTSTLTPIAGVPVDIITEHTSKIAQHTSQIAQLNSSLNQNIIHKATHRYSIGSGWTGTFHKLGTLSDFKSGLTNDKVISFITKTWSGVSGGFNIALDSNDVYLVYGSVTSGGFILVEVCYLE